MSLRTLALLAALLTLVAHAPAFVAGFVTLDDPLYVTANARILSGTFADLWSPRAALHGEFIEFFPLRDSVYWLVAHISHNALGFHAVVLAFHAIACALFVVVVARLTTSLPIGAVAGALFAVHPAHTESTAWIAGLKDSMFLTFMLAAFLAYLAWHEHKRPAFYALALGALLLALLCKAMAIVFPGLVIAHALVVARTSIASAALRTAPFAAIVFAFLLALFVPIGAANEVIIQTPLSFAERIAFALWLVVRYAALLVAPVRLRIWHMDTFIDAPDALRITLLIAFWLAFIALVVWGWRKERAVAFACIWFVVALVPVLNLIPFPAVFADRYSYAASAGVCIALAVLLHRALPARALRGVVVAIVVTFASLTFLRSLQWGDETSLWREVLDDPQSAAYPHPWQKLAEAQYARGDFDGAADTFAHVIEMSPSSPQPLDPRSFVAALHASADAHLRVGRFDVARAHAARLTQLAPNDARAAELLARALALLGDADAAAHEARRGLALAPDGALRWNLALLLTPAERPRALADALAAEPRLCAVYGRWRTRADAAEVAIVDAAAACP